MFYRAALELTVLLHFLFILFVIFGAFVVRRRRKLWPLHWAALAYGLAIEIFNWICPLTYVEWDLRRRLGLEGYSQGFIEHYLTELIYWDVPQWALAAAAAIVVALNAAYYRRLARRG